MEKTPAKPCVVRRIVSTYCLVFVGTRRSQGQMRMAGFDNACRAPRIGIRMSSRFKPISSDGRR